ncbi:hypothetical protein Ae201684_005958 [Aphanomyces euteiches]|uniref:non-specific serine/threonine protein kinase n=1 Tax=Aphanomyces euteiches TaxID=100861 RepID=A0A6G0XCX5_9STRA|nr:hypothetical protein Ae201684_005958 [Aphanomyces euteiches]
MHIPVDGRSMSDQQVDYPSLLLRLYHQSQGNHKGAKKAQEELAQHLQTTSLPVECFDVLLPQFLHFLPKGDGAAKWLVLLFASNLLRTADIMGMMHPPQQQLMLLSILPETIEKWWRLVEEEDNAAQLNMRDGVFVPNAILQSEKNAQKNSQLFALGRLIDTMAQIVRHSDDEDVVDIIARSMQIVMKHAPKNLIQKELDELCLRSLTQSELMRLNSLVVCFMAVAHGLRSLVLTTDNVLRRVLHSLVSHGDKYILNIDTISTISQALVVISQASSASYDPLCVPSVDCLLLHTCVLFQRHLATASEVSLVLDRVLTLLEFSKVQFSLPIVKLLNRQLPLGLPVPFGVPNRQSPNVSPPPSYSFFSLLCNISQGNIMLKVTRICIQCVRLGGIAALQVFCLNAISPQIPDEQKSFSLMAFCVSLTAPVSFVPGDATCLSSMYGKLIQALPKWTDGIFLSGVKAIYCLMQFMQLHIQPSIKASDSAALISILMKSLASSPQTLVFEVIEFMIAQAPLFELAIPFQAPQELHRLCSHPSENVRNQYVRIVRYIDPSPSLLDSVVERVFDSSPEVVSNAMHALGRSVVVRLGHPRFRAKKVASLTVHTDEFGAKEFELLMDYLEYGDREDECLDLLQQSHHSTPLLALKAGVWEAAKWCVYGRLRTHWGNAGQTFGAIERLLLRPVAHPRLLVEFVHALEMAVVKINDEKDEFHAKSVAFFTTNKKVCEDWLLRIRPALIKLCDASGVSSLSRYHALSLINSLSRKPATTEWDTAMFELCISCSDLQDTPELMGIIQYAVKMNQRKPWMAPIQFEAQMNYEAAIEGYKNVVEPFVRLSRDFYSGLNLQFESEDERNKAVSAVQQVVADLGMGPVSFKGSMLRCAQCFAILQDWTSCRQWMEQIMDVATFLTNVQACTSQEIEFVTSLQPLVKSWETEICMLQVHDDDVSLPNMQEWTVLSVVDDANLRQLRTLEQVESHMLWLEQRLRVLTLDEKSCRPLKGENMSRELQRTLMNVQCFVEPKVSAQLTLDPTAHDLGVWHPLATRESSFDFHLQLIRLARKQQNLKFAESKLSQLRKSTPLQQLTVAYEHAQLLSASKNRTAAFELLTQLHNQFSAATIEDEKRIHVKTLIKLASWSDISHLQQSFLQEATELDPESYQAWLSWSDYWYNATNTYLEAMPNHQFSLTIQEKQEFTTIVDTYPELQPVASNVLSALQNFESFNCTDVKGPPAQQLNALYAKARERVLLGYRIAVEGYIKYLSCASPSSLTSHGIIVTLRLLSILVKQGSETSMKSVLDMTVRDSPLQPWERVVPQLLSRLAHPDPIASSRVESILMRLASHSPHLIVYPAVVESTKLTEALSPQLVSQVRQLVSELRRIAVLWDESWLTLLSKLSSDVARRSNTLEKEATRVEKNTSLSLSEKTALAHRKFVAIMKPVLLSLETLAEETIGRQPQTAHEQWFVLHFGDLINSALSKFESCLEEDQASPFRQEKKKAASSDPLVFYVWSPFADILKRLQHASQRRQSLAMMTISPTLASWESSLVHMPGLPSRVIQGLSPQVQILATKTRPKSLEIIGSDGHSYRYLLKAREDLHLDERIMQLLITVNACLSTDKEAMHYDLTARNYSVIPLSNDAGLIQMVPHVTPLFHIFTSTTNYPASSPTAPFYAKLKSSGIMDVTPSGRPRWPIKILREVYNELVSEHSKLNVLLREMMRTSETIQDFGAKATRFSRSTAVMSVVGYIIGLGDRHLDNMLLCRSGDLVHIDYNICFDKGKKLKVPEVVPFRLTPILHSALGLTGVEGRFRHSMETTLRVMRASDTKETILTLLEAFVYDPLVHWKEDATSKKLWRMEMNVQLSLFSSRAQERRSEAEATISHVTDTWRTLKETMHATLEAFSGVLRIIQHYKELQNEEENLKESLAQLSVNSTMIEDDTTELENMYRTAAGELERFTHECQEREEGMRQWLQVEDMGITWEWGSSGSHRSFTDLCSEVLGDSSLERNCRTLDRSTEDLSSLMVQIGSLLQAPLIWYKHMRNILYHGLRGNSIYQEWLHSIEIAEELKSFDTAQMQTQAAERLKRRLDTLTSSSTERLPSNLPQTWHIDTSSVHQEIKQLAHTLTDLKTKWKLSNAQAQKLVKFAIADFWLNEDKHISDPSLEDYSMHLFSTLWLSEVGSASKGSYRSLPIDAWLLAPESYKNEKFPGLLLHFDFVRSIQLASFVISTHMSSNSIENQPKPILEAFKKSLDQALGLEKWQQILATLGWVDTPVLPTSIPLELPTTRPQTLSDISGFGSLGSLLNVICWFEISITKEANAQAIQRRWIQTLVNIAWMTVVDNKTQEATNYLVSQVLPVVALASGSLSSIRNDTCVLEWKFKPNKDGRISHDSLALEWKHAMPLDIPVEANELSCLHLSELVQSMTYCVKASMAKGKEESMSKFIKELRAKIAQQQVIATWLNVRPPIDMSNFSRSDFLGLFPNLEDANRLHDTIHQLVECTASALQSAASKNNRMIQFEIQDAVDGATRLMHQTQALRICLRWIEYVESTFRDSESDTCRSIDTEGSKVITTYVTAKATWNEYQRLRQEQLKDVEVKAQNACSTQEKLSRTQTQLVNAQKTLLSRLDETDLAGPVMSLKQILPEVLAKEKTNVIWENVRLVRILSKNMKGDAEELSELQSTMSTLETKSEHLHTDYSAVLQAFQSFFNQCPDIQPTASSKATMASVLRGKENSKPPTLAEKLAAAEAVYVLVEALQGSKGIAHIPSSMEDVMTLFFTIADLATSLAHESPESDESDSSSDDSESEDDSVTDLKKVQESNQYGMQVLTRVKEKLDGENSKYSVEQQVEWLIQEATSVNNLCQMYEGWTPWI